MLNQKLFYKLNIYILKNEVIPKKNQFATEIPPNAYLDRITFVSHFWRGYTPATQIGSRVSLVYFRRLNSNLPRGGYKEAQEVHPIILTE